MAKRRAINQFSLSFLDVMACGFGAVILIFIVINHSSEASSQEFNIQLLAEIMRIEEQVKNETKNLVSLKDTVSEKEDEIITTEELLSRLIARINRLEAELAQLTQAGASQKDTIESLKSELKKLELEAANLEGSAQADDDTGTSLRTIIGEGDRQYLTGMKVGGEQVLILLDTSASMLDKTLVNVLRRRNLSAAQQRASPKWQRAIKTVEWVLANLPKEAQFQLFTFNAEARPAIHGTQGKWLSSINKSDTDKVLQNIRQMIPHGGTSLHLAYELARNLDPKPDNVFLIVDSLPSMALKPPRRVLITSSERVKLFNDSVTLLSRILPRSPVNVILFPMEGDPLSTPHYWLLAQSTGGSFLSPPEDWP